MKDYEPVMSFGEDVAPMYSDVQCGDEMAAVAFLVDEVRLNVLRHDAATHILEESHVSLIRAGMRLNPVVQRYAWPSELELMARIAGLRLKGRWGGWGREPFNSSSRAHVSVYGR